MKLYRTPTFIRTSKKLHPKQKLVLDSALTEIVKNPTIGTLKKYDLDYAYVYKFKILDQEYLLAYEILNVEEIKLVSLGTHENFYNRLKKKAR